MRGSYDVNLVVYDVHHLYSDLDPTCNKYSDLIG